MASIDRIIAEIEEYLASSMKMKDAKSFSEIEERRSLEELLKQLKESKRKAG